MKERGIMFTAPMVRAILAGRKTMTRRIVNMNTLRAVLPKTVSADYRELLGGPIALRGRYPVTMNRNGAVCALVGDKHECDALGLKPGEFHFACPYASGSTVLKNDRWHIDVEPDQRLYVKETWANLTGNGIRTVYRADGEDPRTGWDVTPPPMKWNSAMMMPKNKSRIKLAVTAVRMERLHEITEDDAAREGVDNGPGRGGHLYPSPRAARGSLGYREVFRELWEKINGKDSWADNPWVWTISFHRLPQAAEES